MHATRREILRYICHRIEHLYPVQERISIARIIAPELEGVSFTKYLIEPDEVTTIEGLEEKVEELAQGRPVQYVLGTAEFCDLKFSVREGVLIPRPETAELVEWVLQMADRNKPLKVLDIGTGSGCIALALKKAAPNWDVTGLDISEDALKGAKENAGRNNAEVHWLQADILSPQCPITSSPHRLHFDIIVSNPPYICNREKKDMDARVLDYEPHSALFVPDTDPLLFYRQIASLATSPAMLFFEINEAYGNEVCEMMAEMGYTDIQLKNDMYGKPRMVFGAITR